MPISIKCPACSAGFRAPEEAAGRKGKCPKCGHVLVVPAAAAPQPSAPRPPPAPPKTPPLPAPANDLGIQFAPPPQGNGSSVIGKHQKKPTPAKVPAVAHHSEAPPAEASSVVFSRRKRQGPPAWLWLAMAGTGLVIVVCGVFYALKDSSPTPVAATTPVQQPAAVAPAESEPAESAPAVAVVNSVPPADVARLVEPAIVRIQTQGAEGDDKSIGAGFVIHRSGLVATNYHVVAECTKADVLFQNGERFAVAGYVALRPDYDLAILKLDGAPADVPALTLSAESPRAEAAVYLVGHLPDQKLQVTGGAITAVSGTADLPESSRQLLKEAGSEKANTQWIRHNATASVANSGGPLVNARGEVVGIHTFVDEESQTGFAVHASHLDLMRRRLSPVAPLAQYRRRPQAVRLGAPGQVASPSVSSLQVAELLAQLATKEWQPESEADYDLFRQLAMALAQAQELRKKPDGEAGEIPEEVKQIEQQADDAALALKEVVWKLETSIPAINRLAASSIAKMGAGVFLFGAYKYPAADAQKHKGMVLLVEGSKQEVFVPYKLPPDLPEETFFLILGMAQGPVLLGDNPLLSAELPRIVPSIVFEIAPN